MSMIDWLLTQSAVVVPFTGERDGHPVYGKPEPPRPCRLQLTKRLDTVMNAGGIYGRQDSVVKASTMFVTGSPIAVRSLVTVNGETYTVTECKEAYGFGPDHLEVKLV